MSDEEEKRKAEERQAYLKEHYSKITKENYEEFVDWCVQDVYSQQDEETKQKIREQQKQEEDEDEIERLKRSLFSVHFGPCLTIRNMYLWHRDYSEYGEVDVDGLSHVIYNRVLDKICSEE